MSKIFFVIFKQIRLFVFIVNKNYWFLFVYLTSSRVKPTFFDSFFSRNTYSIYTFLPLNEFSSFLQYWLSLFFKTITTKFTFTLKLVIFIFWFLNRPPVHCLGKIKLIRFRTKIPSQITSTYILDYCISSHNYDWNLFSYHLFLQNVSSLFIQLF